MSLSKSIKKYLRRSKPQSQPRRLDVFQELQDGFDRGTRKVINLLNYTKSSGSAYDGGLYDVGYHSFKIGEHEFKGQRQPEQRLEQVGYDFHGKTVLDIGCNQGGMLFAVADQVKQGIGIDYDSRMINAANRLRSYLSRTNLDFFVFDLQKENLEIIQDFLPNDPVDITFLLSVCMWIENWQGLIDFVHKLSEDLLFETNGKSEQQDEQVAYLQSKYASVRLISAISEDDPKQKKRRLYLCSRTA